MAGDALSAKDEGFRNSNDRRLGAEEYDRLSGSGLQDADESGRYSAKEVIAEMRHGRDGKTTEEMADYYQGLVDDGTQFNARAQEFLGKHGVTFGGGGGGEDEDPIVEVPETPETPDPTPAPSPTPGPSPSPVGPINVDGGIFQDNDISTVINGSDNNVTNNQDNSIGGASSYAKELRDKYVLNLTSMTGV